MHSLKAQNAVCWFVKCISSIDVFDRARLSAQFRYTRTERFCTLNAECLDLLQKKEGLSKNKWNFHSTLGFWKKNIFVDLYLGTLFAQKMAKKRKYSLSPSDSRTQLANKIIYCLSKHLYNECNWVLNVGCSSRK